MKKEEIFSKLRIAGPSNEKKERTKSFNNVFIIRNGEEVAKLYLKSDVLLPTCLLEKFIKVSSNEIDISSLNCGSLPSFTWLWGLKYTGIVLQILQDKDLILLHENNIRGVYSL